MYPPSYPSRALVTDKWHATLRTVGIKLLGGLPHLQEGPKIRDSDRKLYLATAKCAPWDWQPVREYPKHYYYSPQACLSGALQDRDMQARPRNP